MVVMEVRACVCLSFICLLELSLSTASHRFKYILRSHSKTAQTRVSIIRYLLSNCPIIVYQYRSVERASL
jgi:hypothetical protein